MTTKRVETVKHGLSKDNRPMFEGHTIGHTSRNQRLAREHGTVCVDCGEDRYHGVFRVAVTEWSPFGNVPILGRLSHQRTDSVTFTCLDCLHERDPVTYPETGAFSTTD